MKDLLKVFLTQNYSIYSPTRIYRTLLGVIVIDGDTYSIYIDEKAVVKPGDAEYTGLIGRIFKMRLRQQKFIEISRKYFDPKNLTKFDQQGLQILSGVMCNLVSLEEVGKYYINIDSAFKVLRQSTFVEDLRNAKGNYQQFEGLVVMTVYNYKFYRLINVDTTKTPKSEFLMQDGKNLSFIDYYQSKYNLKIKDVNQPLLSCQEKSRYGVQKVIYLVPEICVATGLTDKMRANFQTMKQLSTITKPKGQERVTMANKFIQGFQQSEDLLKLWNIQLDQQCLKVDSSKINAGSLLMGNQSIPIETANLDRDTQTQMFKTSLLENWCLLSHANDNQLVNEFQNSLRESIDYCKFPCKPPKQMTVNSQKIQDWINCCQQIANNFMGSEKVQLILLVLQGPKKNSPIYSDLKRFLVNLCPIPSQVVMNSTIVTAIGGHTTLSLQKLCIKLLNQINAKLGGTPWAISDMPLTDSPTMICGMDVYHQTMRGKNSVLSFVSTEDKYFSTYHTQTQLMDVGNEFGFNLCPILLRSIQSFAGEKKTQFPERIIIYRDGVSNSQAKVVIESEINQFRQAIDLAKKEFNIDKDIKLILISVNKKVGAKFYAGERNLDNPPQGTLIDTQICQNNKDFYLISQKATAGTVQPTHYHVLVNDITEDPHIFKKLQVLSYKLCYLYFNFTGAIKIPAPIQYAHVCSNFIGDRYDPKDPKSLIKSNDQLNKRRSLFFI
uniref:Piwi a2.1 n=1 Tax=Paramecium bursaria TaxID=74790 RepID=A0A8G1CXY5_9CILI|nr:piwi a2.1 [Paramecium bursaria]